MKSHGLQTILSLAALCLSTSVQADETLKIPYGAEPTSYGELRLPTGTTARLPVAVLVHGGCWRADRGTAESFRPMAEALAADGIATWNTRPLAAGRTTMVMPDYPALARAAGDHIQVDIVDEADHFDFMRPGTKAYEALHRGIVEMVLR